MEYLQESCSTTAPAGNSFRCSSGGSLYPERLWCRLFAALRDFHLGNLSSIPNINRQDAGSRTFTCISCHCNNYFISGGTNKRKSQILQEYCQRKPFFTS